MKFLCFFLCLSAFAQEITPTVKVEQSLAFEDDLDFVFLDKAIERQLKNFSARTLTGTIKFGDQVYKKNIVKESLILLKQLSSETKTCLAASERTTCREEFSRQMNQLFSIYKPVPKSTELGYSQMRSYFTSYYTPDFRGSREKTAEFKNPIYALPLNETERVLSRVEIDLDRKLDGKNLELLWVKETLFDIYFMHIQGGGRVVLPDGSTTYLSYNGKNGKKFEFVSKYLIESGLMPQEQTNYFTQRAFLEAHPEHQRATYNTAPFFIYFKETNHEPEGIESMSLTEGRSLAWDNTIYKTSGVINFIQSVKTTHLDENNRPVKQPFSRFFLAQDTGSAIRGNARADLYWGYGEEALFVAGKLMEVGDQFFLIKK